MGRTVDQDDAIGLQLLLLTEFELGLHGPALVD
jgi:hypothetical protein